MRHGYEFPIGRGDQIDLVVCFRKFFLQHHHCKHGRSRRDIAGAHLDTVGRHHARARISFGRTKRNTRFELPGGIDQCCAFSRQQATMLSSRKDLRKKITQLPAVSTVSNQRVEPLDHCRIEIRSRDSDWEHP